MHEINDYPTCTCMYSCNCFYLYVGKTLLVKAVANQTSATFLRVCGSELIQKYLVWAYIIATMLLCVCCTQCTK